MLPSKLGKMSVKKFKGLAFYVGFNTVFAFALYFGFFEGIDGAENLALFIGWATAIVGTLMLFGIGQNRAEISKSLYKANWEPASWLWFDVLYDVCVVLVFAWAGHYVLAAFYILSIMSGIEMRKCQKEYTFEMLTKSMKEG